MTPAKEGHFQGVFWAVDKYFTFPHSKGCLLGKTSPFRPELKGTGQKYPVRNMWEEEPPQIEYRKRGQTKLWPTKPRFEDYCSGNAIVDWDRGKASTTGGKLLKAGPCKRFTWMSSIHYPLSTNNNRLKDLLTMLFGIKVGQKDTSWKVQSAHDRNKVENRNFHGNPL